MKQVLLPLLGTLLWTAPLPAQPRVELTSETIAAFEGFTSALEQFQARRLDGRVPFLWADESAGRRAELQSGGILAESLGDPPLPEAAGGLVHAWTGAMFVPKTSVDALLRVLQDYDRHQDWYQEVVESRTIGREGDSIRAFLRLEKTQGLTVTLNTEHEASYTQIADTRWVGTSRSTKIAEVRDAGEANETELPVGRDSGFLWRMNAYWRLEESDDGVYAECVSVTLSRRVPRGLGWLINPFIREMPRESLEATLEATRQAVSVFGAR
jgi:hypothetical protein